MGWSILEVEATVADYFEMLALQLRGEKFNKRARHRTLAQRLGSRSEKAIERKHRNISAILLEEDRPWIAGYKPLHNYQGLLREVVVARLDSQPALDNLFARAVDAPVPDRVLDGHLQKPEGRPALKRPTGIISESPASPARRAARKTNYLEREAHNQSIGRAGERLVLDFERRRLRGRGLDALADSIRHTSLELGDGLGFDIHSFELDGRDRFIEVKTTAYGKETPFFVSRSEVAFSRERGLSYHLYRVFKLLEKPGHFTVPGPLTEGFELQPEIFRAHSS